jgi:SAM-dependent methyltransferase
MRDYYEELWERLPQDLEPPHLQLRRQFMLGHVRPGERVLDVGSGSGIFTAQLAAAGADPVGVEVADAALRRARAAHPGIPFALAPVEGPLPFEDSAFDAVWASEVIEHIADTARWLSEIRRVLRPAGRLLLTTPNHARLAILFRGLEYYADPLSDHLHLYTRRSLRQVLVEFGLREIVVRLAGGPPLSRSLLLASALR